ncbi:AMP-binding protein [Spongiibacter sp. KMU-158]|uniref:AMP-binding protein n=1 Tax=Spongiibacter pelagi TaxID=2760804 RepID=A0A927C142_9GAMM|nr:AMP-binding protein [Spongiibacter pelagi]MBD2858804.1 AMP-binding protein [Spongiibacter pelagi]
MTTFWTPVEGAQHWAEQQPNAIYLSQPNKGEVRDYTWAQCLDEAKRMANYIQGMDLPQGSRIAVLSSNCAHMILADLAIWMSGHVSLPVYPSLNSETLGYILEHSESQMLFVGKLDNWASMAPGVPDNMPMVLINGATHTGVEAPSWDEIVANTVPTETIIPRDKDELARMIYTSGSTGQPKGVMCSFTALEAGSRVIGHLLELTPEDRMLSYLPLAHVFEAAAVEMNSLRHGFRVYFSEGLTTFATDLQRARPTVFQSVPRLWVKFQQGVLAAVPQEKLSELLADENTAKATQQNILTKLGLQDTRIAVTGSAPLAPSVMEWYRSIGLELLEGYAMSEDFAYSHLSFPNRSRIGYVGEAVPGVERRLSEQGEVQIKSPGGMMGYFKDAEKTTEAYTDDGWFRTGDLGEVDELGRLKITGRLKEIFKTSKGKYVAPVPIECKIGHPLVESVCVSGANQAQPFVLLMPSAIAGEKLSCNEAKRQFESEISELLEQVNQTLDPHEALSFAVMVKDSWTIENGMLTPTMKIRRNIIEERYSETVDAWYAERKTVVWECPTLASA